MSIVSPDFTVAATPIEFADKPAYIEAIELATETLSSPSTDCGIIRHDMLLSYYNQDWIDSEDIYFILISRYPLSYNGSTSFHKMFYGSWAGKFVFYIDFRIVSFFDKFEHSDSPISIDCYGNSLLYSSMLKSVGCPINLNNIDNWNVINDKDINYRRLWAIGDSGPSEAGIWGSHFVSSYDYEIGSPELPALQTVIYDPTAMLSYNQSDPEIEGLECFGYLGDMDIGCFITHETEKYYYKEHLLSSDYDDVKLFQTTVIKYEDDIE